MEHLNAAPKAADSCAGGQGEPARAAFAAHRRMTRILGAVLFGATLAGPAGAQSTGDQALEIIGVAARGADRVKSLWPQYDPFARGFIIFDPRQGAWLVSSSTPPEPWTPIASAEPRVNGRLFFRPAQLSGLTGGIALGYRVGNETYTAVQIESTVRATLATLYHEAFHEYQQSAFGPPSGTHIPHDATTARQLADIELERRILAGALKTESPPRRDSLIAAFLALRAERMRSLSDSTRRVERSLETTEGTAYLVGHLAASAALGQEPRVARNAVVRMLEQDLAFYGGDVGSRYYRWRAYGTGAAVGLLLSNDSSSWRTDLAAGTALDALLARTARVRPSVALLPAARAAFGYEKLLKSAERNLRSAVVDPIAAFFALAPYRVTIEIDSTPGEPPTARFAPGKAGIVTPAPQLTLMNNPQRVSITYPGLDASIQKRPVMIDGREPGVFRYVVLLPSQAKLNGEPATDIRAADPGKTYELSGEDTKIVLRGLAIESISVTADGMTIRVRAQ
jgi:hypothetical protein